MEYRVQIGRVAFLIDTPYPYKWNATDHKFLSWDGTAFKTVHVAVEWGKICLPQRKLDVTADLMDIWVNGETEIRAFRATFYPGHPLFACSCRVGDRVEITFCGDIDLWNHPNMQLWSIIHLEKFLLETGGIVLHCCYTMYRGKAILFTAPSGTGKTTQANIWRRCYGSEIINGDKCLLQRIDGQWFAEGYPYHGSADECENRSYPIGSIAIVRQSKNDMVESISPVQALGLLYSESTVNNWDSKRVNTALGLLTDLALKVPVVKLCCTMEDSAAHVLHRYLYGGDYGTV